MTPEHSHYLRDCNCMVRYGGSSSWLPTRLDTETGRFYSPNGLRVVDPAEHRMLSHGEIVAEMDSRGDMPVIQPLPCMGAMQP